MRRILSAAAVAVIGGLPAATAVEPALRHSLWNGKHPRTPNSKPVSAPLKTTPGSANCTTHWIEQSVDHFNWGANPAGNPVWQERYLTYDNYWRNDSTGLIFFYVGNEGPVELYADHTGLMWENAEAMGAYIVFAEHRYYGLSQPFGDATPEFMNYLTHEQALADYAHLILTLQQQLGAQGQPVVVFGGSYGGMLAAWMRLKYPGVVAGAVAASAPLLGFQGMAPSFNSETYWQVVTRDMTPAAGAASACSANVRAAWNAMDSFAAAGRAGLATLSEIFQLCTPLADLSDVALLKLFHLNVWDTCAMGNFPYPSNYLTGTDAELPAYPVRAMCNLLSNASLVNDPYALLVAFNAAGAVFNNATQDVACYALPASDPFLDGIWDYQWCTQTLPEETYFTRDGQNDAFYPFSMSNDAVNEHCYNKYAVLPRWTWIREQYGGRHHGGTNIVFSNGEFDPWRSGGILPNTTGDTASTPAIDIAGSAHHTDLFFSNPADPPSFKAARATEVALIKQWADQWRQRWNETRAASDREL